MGFLAAVAIIAVDSRKDDLGGYAANQGAEVSPRSPVCLQAARSVLAALAPSQTLLSARTRKKNRSRLSLDPPTLSFPFFKPPKHPHM